MYLKYVDIFFLVTFLHILLSNTENVLLSGTSDQLVPEITLVVFILIF